MMLALAALAVAGCWSHSISRPVDRRTVVRCSGGNTSESERAGRRVVSIA